MHQIDLTDGELLVLRVMLDDNIENYEKLVAQAQRYNLDMSLHDAMLPLMKSMREKVNQHIQKE